MKKLLQILTISSIVVLKSQADTIDFNFTGGAQTWVTPSGVTSVFVELWGAQGYSSGGYSGGLGGYTSGNLSVTAGQALYFYVGGAGTEANIVNILMGGGFNGGGNGVVWNNGTGLAGGGGGATDVRVGGTSYADRVGVAGGGGGATENYNAFGGNGGGPIGQDGYMDPVWGGAYFAGTGGSQVAGGNVGGSFGVGGDAIIGATGWVGGGGGGWYGGGASPAHFGGGGGSSYIDGLVDGVMLQGTHSGDGFAKITFSVESVPESSATLGLMLATMTVLVSMRRRFHR